MTMTSLANPNPALLELLIRRVTREAQGINSYELVDPNGGALPPFTAGSHIDIHLPNGMVRQYSLSNSPAEPHRYVIGVLRDERGTGGSIAVHQLHVGETVRVSVPRNNFMLSKEARKSILLAGGIGVTPMKSMMHALESAKQEYELHYCCKGPEFAAFSEEMEELIGEGKVVLHFDGGDPSKSFDLQSFLKDAPEGCHVYYCGPAGFMNACKEAAAHWPAGTVHFEHFKAPVKAPEPASAEQGNGSFVARIASNGEEIVVQAHENLAQVLQDAGYPVETSCQSGLCGTCKIRYLEGEVDHQDYILDDSEKGSCLTACVSRAKSKLLVLDL
ncbi:TPA: oxidoreductase [Pseudomonas aeruginosa]|uniref:PDR/VanB family oxidoreductase n=1 Tax=Pseudomonas putida TaxID=303 RepID=UPI0010703846|nr:PDR/VanB family oxidoreductase [Pseudomonas putida]TFF51361.1 oxidoreductase [Pseudomonas putida]HCF4778768.1 oxidoreductase [Pseudomonas aeruginosa]